MKILSISIIILFPFLSSCTHVSIPTNSIEPKLNRAVKPTLVKLNSKSSDQSLVKLRWTGSIPSMDMSQTNSGSGWQSGIKESNGVYSFTQGKFYGLTLDFNKSIFIETGFDGAWLPEVKGTWTAIK